MQLKTILSKQENKLLNLSFNDCIYLYLTFLSIFISMKIINSGPIIKRFCVEGSFKISMKDYSFLKIAKWFQVFYKKILLFSKKRLLKKKRNENA